MAEGHPHHHAGEPPAAGDGQEDDQQNVGDAHDQVNPPGDEGVHPAAKHGGQNAQCQGHPCADSGGEQPNADAQREAC